MQPYDLYRCAAYLHKYRGGLSGGSPLEKWGNVPISGKKEAQEERVGAAFSPFILILKNRFKFCFAFFALRVIPMLQL